jgi:integrase
MATLTIEIGRKNKNRLHPVSFLICQGKTKKRIPTDILVTDSELTSNHKKVKEYNKAFLLEKKRRELQDRLNALSLELIGQDVDADYIAKKIVKVGNKLDFFTFADEWIAKSNLKWLPNYKCAINALEKYLGRRTLQFTDITYDLLDGFCKSLVGLQRAPSMYIRIIKQLIKEARLRYNTDSDIAIPFTTADNFKTPKETARRIERSVDVETIRKIIAYEGEGRASLARDCYLLSFCLMGMNSVDLYNCTILKDNVIKYNRSKTKGRREDEAYIEVAVPAQILPILNKYRRGNRVFDFCNRYANFQNFNSNLNKGLKTMCKEIGIKDITFYSARHSWASIARNDLRIDKYTIHEALNHVVDDMAITDRYIKRDFSIINDANAAVVDYVFTKSPAAHHG